MGRRQRPIRHCTALATRAGCAAALDEGLTVRSTNVRQTPVAQPVLRRPFDPPVAERGTERGETAQGIQGIEPFGRGEGGRHWRGYWRGRGEMPGPCARHCQCKSEWGVKTCGGQRSGAATDATTPPFVNRRRLLRSTPRLAGPCRTSWARSRWASRWRWSGHPRRCSVHTRASRRPSSCRGTRRCRSR